MIRFEDLIGTQGGSSTAQQEATVQRIATHLGKPFDDAMAAQCQQIYSTSARTFRQGSINGWQQTLDNAQVKRIQRYCEPLCHAAGYSV